MTDLRISRGRPGDTLAAAGIAATMPNGAGRVITPRCAVSVNGLPRLIPLVRRVAPNRLRWTSLYDRLTSDFLPGSDEQRKEAL
jgi:hypothetical protein